MALRLQNTALIFVSLLVILFSVVRPVKARDGLDASALFRGPELKQTRAQSADKWLGVFSAAELESAKNARNPIVMGGKANLKTLAKSNLDDIETYRRPYDGCDINQITKKLSYEFAGAARAASDLAIYSYVAAPEDAALAASAKSAARDVLLGWATQAKHFRDMAGDNLAGFCENDVKGGEGTRFSVGLVIGRATPYLVSAFAVLRQEDALSPEQTAAIQSFFDALYDIEVVAMNYRAIRSNLDCNRFNNHVSIQLAALASLASLNGDMKRLQSIADGTGGGIAIPWTLQVSRTIYGDHATLLDCYRNDADPSYFQQDDRPQLGEIVDRYRAGPEQTLGYPLFSLEHLLLAGRALAHFGFPAFSPNKDGDRIKASLDFYADLLSVSLRGQRLDMLPKFQQYRAKVIAKGDATVSGADFRLASFVLGSSVYRKEQNIGGLFEVVEVVSHNQGAFYKLPGMFLPVVAATNVQAH